MFLYILAIKLLKQLEQEFCQDLLLETNDALLWLASTNDLLDQHTKSQQRAFSFDYKALYDSLDPHLVVEAITVAMEECREEWPEEQKKWIIDLVQHSLKSSIGQFGDHFYKQKKGVPTGGSLCVQLANIAVFYLMRKEVYSDPALMANITALKRYIDDGSGFFSGTQAEFSTLKI